MIALVTIKTEVLASWFLRTSSLRLHWSVDVSWFCILQPVIESRLIEVELFCVWSHTLMSIFKTKQQIGVILRSSEPELFFASELSVSASSSWLWCSCTLMSFPMKISFEVLVLFRLLSGIAFRLEVMIWIEVPYKRPLLNFIDKLAVEVVVSHLGAVYTDALVVVDE